VRSKHVATSVSAGYLLFAATNDEIPYKAAWSCSDLPNLARSGGSIKPLTVEAAGFLYDYSQEWKLTFFGTLTFSIVP
jgi:hypothetical protein